MEESQKTKFAGRRENRAAAVQILYMLEANPTDDVASALSAFFAERERRPQEEQEPVAALRNSAYTGNYHLDIFGTAKVYE